jgi:hypothetical protein
MPAAGPDFQAGGNKIKAGRNEIQIRRNEIQVRRNKNPNAFSFHECIFLNRLSQFPTSPDAMGPVYSPSRHLAFAPDRLWVHSPASAF